MAQSEYHDRISRYYSESENAYKDSWDLDHSLAIHYGFRDDQARSFRASLGRMNVVMAEMAEVKEGEMVLDAGCGVGGSAIFLAKQFGCRVTGITLSGRQAEIAEKNIQEKGLEERVDIRIMNYMRTEFPDNSFDLVWGCESICYADDKAAFVREAFRVLKPGGRLIIADGLVTRFENNEHPVNRKWLDGWQVNYLETPERFLDHLSAAGFMKNRYRDITKETSHSAKRLYRFYFLARIYLKWMWIKGSQPTEMQRRNIEACKFQYFSRKRKLSGYGLILGWKPGFGKEASSL
jgi:cyclopropane fatty-acyl-phospholipid synthase-like methyltransferase